MNCQSMKAWPFDRVQHSGMQSKSWKFFLEARIERGHPLTRLKNVLLEATMSCLVQSWS